MDVQLAPLVVDESQPVTLPVFPVNVSVPVAVDPQNSPPPVTVPATLTGLTVMIALVEESAGQPPLCTIA